ncbi:fumarylacetoacetate hydrolase family protein [Nocardia terpenica]|uniref:MBL fold metallo-hydrolase n=1 Tax=Nocardia terpenica TaxID=455432 RepID=A0A6G9Z257_9NOCA|nr:fumarylacetoacetate hydrolase family protein [Nocardia terpenica]QIS19461.1 MBL fold metallo-hydrolase [Nocardia terpenica]
MRWVTYVGGNEERVGVLNGEVIHGLSRGHTLLELIAQGADRLADIGAQALRQPAEVVPLSDVTLRAPIPRPPSIRDCLCFLDHMRNCQQAAGAGRTLGDTWYRVPAFYFACPATVLGPYEDAPKAPGSAWWDFELEIAAVIGTGGRDLDPEQAERAIIGYTIANDWSARDLQQLDSQLRIGQGKGKDAGITLGPYLVTADELEPYRRNGRLALAATALINDRVVGSGNTAAMDWTFGEVISYASRGVELRPGDVFGSGTVPTCTLVEKLDPADPAAFPGWLADGDVVTLRVEGLGETRQTVRATPAPYPLAARPNPDRPARPPRVNPAPARFGYTRGLHRVGTDVWAWTVPDGGYGASNAGLIVGDGESLLVDTLYDLPLTREMLAAMAPHTRRAPITRALNTHANGDHTYGNQLLAESVRIIAAAGTAQEMAHEMPPEMTTMLQVADLGPALTPFLRDRFSSFDFGDIRLRHPDETFDTELTVSVGGRQVRLLNLGPAHTAADSIAHIPDAGVLFAGDLLFIGCTPIVWTGPIANWITACDTMIALDAPTIVPGHGPITDPDGIRNVRNYLSHISTQAEQSHRAGLPWREAAARIDLAEYTHWLDPERCVVNIYQRYRELDPTTETCTPPELFAAQAEWDAKRG